MRAGRVSILGALPFAAALTLAAVGADERAETGVTEPGVAEAVVTEPGVTEPGATGAAGYEPIGADSEPLRTAFNSGTGKVRVLMLVAPT